MKNNDEELKERKLIIGLKSGSVLTFLEGFLKEMTVLRGKTMHELMEEIYEGAYRGCDESITDICGQTLILSNSKYVDIFRIPFASIEFCAIKNEE